MSWNFRKTSAFLWLGLGLLAGLLVAGFWPSVPLHAVATDKIETFSMATGHVEDYEAVFFLDHLTGDLRAFVIGRLATGGFGVLQYSERNIMQDFQAKDEKTPKFIMVTGMSDLAARGRAGNLTPSHSVLYVADVTSGKACVYAVPFTSGQHMTGRPVVLPLAAICDFPIRKVMGAGKKGGKNGDDN